MRTKWVHESQSTNRASCASDSYDGTTVVSSSGFALGVAQFNGARRNWYALEAGFKRHYNEGVVPATNIFDIPLILI